METFIVLACISMTALGAPQGPASLYGLPYTGKSESPVAIVRSPVSAPAATSPVALAPPSAPLFRPAPSPASFAPAPSPALRVPAPSPVFLTPVRSPASLAPVPSPSFLAPAPGAPGAPLAPSAPAPASLAPAPSPASFAPAPGAPAAPPAPAFTSPSALPAPDTFGQKVSAEEIVLPKNARLSIQDKRGQYSHGFSDKQGTQVSEQGRLISTNGGWEYVIAKKGSYSYVSPEGKTITVNYIADENGFRVLGDLQS